MAGKKASSGGSAPQRKRRSQKKVAPVRRKSTPVKKPTKPQAVLKAVEKKVARMPKPKVKAAPVVRAPLALGKGQGFPIVGIGSSAGGLEALESFFKAMPSDSGAAFVLVVHLDPTHVSILPELLQKHTKMTVLQIQDGMKVEPNSVYVIPPNKALSLLNGVLQLMEPAQPRGANLPIDTFFRSLAQDQGASAICVILSGTGTDGTLGLKAIKGETGMVMVQSRDSAKYDGMPRSAIASGLADYVLPASEMPKQLVKYVRHMARRAAPAITPATGKVPNALQKIFVVLRARTNHDFSLYKKSTICRRIERRMGIHQIDDISDYVRYLQESEREAQALFRELLIGVTSFFRDPQAFEALKNKVLLKALQGKPPEYTLRAWVPGCSSGEEAYSIAILLKECMEETNRHVNVQIFGTDIDDDAIGIARAGVYPGSIVADLGAERLKRHFSKEDNGQYRIRKSIREMLVFATQDMIKDPPFTKLDLLACRNLLIYLGPELQKRLLPIFHYSLLPDGALFLGTSETIGQNTDLFAMLDKRWKLFRRKPMSIAAHPMLRFTTGAMRDEELAPATSDAIQKAEELSALQLVETILQQSDTPPCAIVDETGEIIYIHGRTGRYLEPAQGRVSVNILEMARPGLKAELAAAIRKASQRKQEVTENQLRVQHDGGHLFLDLTVRPIVEQTALRRLMMVVFHETAAPPKTKPGGPKRGASKAASRSVEQLEQDLQYTRENLQTTIEELETSNEELKSTNEELQSTNEELQSANEELETSKEELQSLNEESATVNAELQSRIDDLSKANDDMKNLLDSTEIATIFLDAELCIRRFTAQTTEIIPLAAMDTGRPIKHFATNLIEVDLTAQAEEVLNDLVVRETEVRTRDSRVFVLRVRPYRTVSNVIDGVVMTFQDITVRKKAEEMASDVAAFPAENPNPVFRVARDGTVLFANTPSRSLLRSWECEVGSRVPKEWKERIVAALHTNSPKRIDFNHGDRSLSLEVVPIPERDCANVYGSDITRLTKAADTAKNQADKQQRRIESLRKKLSDTAP
jgi:two-component system, chemotaxis family, CheB/CheR fusion protein